MIKHHYHHEFPGGDLRCPRRRSVGPLEFRGDHEVIETLMATRQVALGSTLWLFNIAMENPL